MPNFLIVIAVFFGIVMSIIFYNTGKTSGQNKTCQQAYAEDVDRKIPICRIWKDRIDRETNEKLGVKNDSP
jgi:hypothetical protein